MSNEGLSVRLPSKRANAELDSGEFLSGVFNFEVLNIKAVELEGLSPGSAGDAGHFQIDGDKVGVFNVEPEVVERGLKVGFCNIFNSECRS